MEGSAPGDAVAPEEATADARPAPAEASEPPAGSGDAAPAAADEPISKAEARRQRKLERKLQYREQAREKRLEKKKAQKRRKQEARHQLLESMTKEEREAFIEREREEGRQRKAAQEASLKHAYETGAPKIVVNCSFGENMDYKELTSVAKQAQLCYTAVRDLLSPVQLHFTSLGADNPSMRAFEAIGVKGWMVHVHNKSVWELFDQEQLVVLTPDAEEDLEEVRTDRIYVVGGLVDRSVDKNRSISQAREKGAACIRRLPLKLYGPPGAHPVLNIDTVVRILAEVQKRGPGSWSEVFVDCLPSRHAGGPTRRMLRKQRAQERKACAEGSADPGSGQSSSESESSDGAETAPAAEEP